MNKIGLYISTVLLGALGWSSVYSSDDVDPNDGPTGAETVVRPVPARTRGNTNAVEPLVPHDHAVINGPIAPESLEEIAPNKEALAEAEDALEQKAQKKAQAQKEAHREPHREPQKETQKGASAPGQTQSPAPSRPLPPGTENPSAPASVDAPTGEPSESGAATAEASKTEVPPSVPSKASTEVKPLVLLNSEVPPGTSASLAWRPSTSFSSIAAPTTVLVANGTKPGPTLCLTAAIHGDELNGIEIVRKVMFDIDPQALSGAVIGVPIVNLDGFRRASRYLTDRRDLNRFFPGNPTGSSASRLAYSFFTEIIEHCHLLIDLHTGSFRRTNLPQLRADLTYTQVTELADKMGSILVVQSDGAVGSLRRAAVEAGIPAVTLEAGAAHEFSRTAVEAGVKSVESALDGLKMLDLRRFWERTPQPIYFDSTWVRANHSGILFSNVELGQHVEKGEILGTITDPITNVQALITAPIDGHVIGKALNQIMFPGFAAYHLGYKAEPHPEIDLAPFKGKNASKDFAVDLPLVPGDADKQPPEIGDLVMEEGEEMETEIDEEALDPQEPDTGTDE